MGTNRIKIPKFNHLKNAITIPPSYMETIRREAVDSDLSKYQKRYKIIEFLPIRKDFTFKTTTVAGSPLVWTLDEACAATPMGSIKTGRTSLEPSRLRSFMKFCPSEETYDTLFRAMIEWGVKGRQNLGKLLPVIDMVLKEDLVMLTQGLLAVNFLGQLFDYEALGFRGSASPQEQKDFALQANIFKGLLKQLIDSPMPSLYHPDILPNSLPPGSYSGININSIATELLGRGSKKLRRLVGKGAMRDGRGGEITPVLLCSSNLIADLFKLGMDHADKTATNNGILEEIQVRIIDGVQEYFWRNVPIVPLDEFCIYDDYINSDMYFVALTATRNIQVGSNYQKFDDVENRHIGVTYQRIASDDIRNGDAGSYYRDTHALTALEIANPELFSSTFKVY